MTTRYKGCYRGPGHGPYYKKWQQVFRFFRLWMEGSVG